LTALERRFQKFKIQKTEVEVSGNDVRPMTRAQIRQNLKSFLAEIVTTFPEKDLLEDRKGNGLIKHGRISNMVSANGFSVPDEEITECLWTMGIKATYLRRGPAGEGNYYILKPGPGIEEEVPAHA
jgi:hypothetical protein